VKTEEFEYRGAHTMTLKQREAKRLTVADIVNATVGETKFDGAGLEITRTRADRWQATYRYTSRVTGKRRTPSKTWDGPKLKAMREWHEPLVRDVEAGIDPLLAREQKAIEAQFRNRKHRAQWLASIEGSLPRALLDKPISDVTAGDLLDVLLPLRDRVPETASRVRQRLAAVFDDAALRGLCAGNPAALIARRMRQRKNGEKPHLRALHYRDVPALLEALRVSPRISRSVRLAIEFAVHTASRSGETRGARWNEIDRKARLWTIAGARMKAGEAHRVHLSPRALEILDEAAELRTDRADDALVFPAPRDPKREIADMSLTVALRRLKTGRKHDDGTPETFAEFTTMHGLARSTFSTWANDKRAASSDAVEVALAHRETDRVKAAYDRSRTEGERFERELKALRLAWSDYVCNGKRGKVVPFSRGAA
jgi:integrase